MRDRKYNEDQDMRDKERQGQQKEYDVRDRATKHYKYKNMNFMVDLMWLFILETTG